jgi:Ser/Thr protein kinase RdoA (MazF antagonist)
VTVEEAERLAATSFGQKVRARPLGSQQDSNFLLVEPDGQVAGVLKIANPAFTMAEIQAQDAAAEHVAAAAGWLRAGTVRHGPVTVVTDSGPVIARVLRYLPGGTLAGPVIRPRWPGSW